MERLRLRPDFQGADPSGTTLALRRPDGRGALDMGMDALLDLTYPTPSFEFGLQTLAPQCPGLVVLRADRASGKTHLVAVMHHLLTAPARAEAWAWQWGQRIGSLDLRRLKIPRDHMPLTFSLHDHQSDLLWDLFFEYHPVGSACRRGYKHLGNWITFSLLHKMFKAQPTVLLLDEFGTWCERVWQMKNETLVNQQAKVYHFLQMMSEFARLYPGLLKVVVTLRTCQTAAYEQVMRHHPVVINVMSDTTKRERERLVLHRLFENRDQIDMEEVRRKLLPYEDVYSRLIWRTPAFVIRGTPIGLPTQSWPFASSLYDLIEAAMGVSDPGQRVGDLLKVLALLYQTRTDDYVLLTAAAFDLTASDEALQALRSVLHEERAHRLYAIAQRTLRRLQKAAVPVPHAGALLSALWLRTLATDPDLLATPAHLHLDMSGREHIGEAGHFDEALQLILQHAPNIHRIRGSKGPVLELREKSRRLKFVAQHIAASGGDSESHE